MREEDAERGPRVVLRMNEGLGAEDRVWGLEWDQGLEWEDEWRWRRWLRVATMKRWEERRVEGKVLTGERFRVAK